MGDQCFGACRGAGPEFDEGDRGFAPFVVRAGDDGAGGDRGMAIEGVFDFERTDVLAAGNDDVLGAILDDDIAMLVEYAEITGVKPAASKGLVGSLLVPEIAFHHDIAAEHHFTDGFTVVRHLEHGIGIEHGDGFLQRVGYALAAF